MSAITAPELVTLTVIGYILTSTCREIGVTMTARGSGQTARSG